MLRQGSFVADICFVVPEGGPYRFIPPIPATVRGVIPNRPPYNFDGCPAELVFQMKVEDGSIVLPSGMRYHILVLPTYNANGKPVLRLTNTADYAYQALPMPEVKTMTPALLRKVRELVESGATVLGHRPLQSPSLSSFPACDAELQDLADSLWGKDAGRDGTGERKLGKGRVVWGSTPEEVFAAGRVPPTSAPARTISSTTLTAKPRMERTSTSLSIMKPRPYKASYLSAPRASVRNCTGPRLGTRRWSPLFGSTTA